MNAKLIIVILITGLSAGAGGWLAARRFGRASLTSTEGQPRRVLYYQSSMHPWIKSDQPGNCTICGMKLTPVYEGEEKATASPDLVLLPSNSIAAIHLRTRPVERRKIERTLRVAGRIDDDDTRHRFVAAYVEGRIDRLFVNHVGAEVTEGQPLATFYSPSLLTAEREYLAVLRGISIGPAEASEQTHHALLAGAEQRLRRMGLAPDQIQSLRNKPENQMHTELRAPVTGTVVQRFVYEGEYVREGDKLFEIADFNTMWFLFDAYERDLAWLKPGLEVEITTASLPGITLRSSIRFIDPNLNETTRSAQVRVELPNPLVEGPHGPRRQLYHRLYADAVVRSPGVEALSAPRSAILQAGSQAVAYVEMGPGAYRQVKVQTGRVGDEFVEIIRGLAEGDKVVTAGNLLVDAQSQLNHPEGGRE